MKSTIARPSRKRRPMQPIEVAARFESLVKFLDLRSLCTDSSNREENIERLREVRQAAEKLSRVWPEISRQCLRTIAAIDRILHRLNARPVEADRAELVAAGSGVSA